jgi:hypothetical protein
MIILKNGRGQLGEALCNELANVKIIPTEDVFIYHTWDMDCDKNDNASHRECFAKFKDFVHFNSKKKIFFISTYSSKHNSYNVYKQKCESYLSLYCDSGYSIRLPVLTGKGICSKLKSGVVNPYGDIELITHQAAAKGILDIVEEVIVRPIKDPTSGCYRLEGTKIPASLVQELIQQ